MLIPSLVLLTASLLPQTQHTTYSADQLAAWSGHSVVQGQFRLAAGESAAFTLEAPLAFRTVGAWWNGALSHAEVSILEAGGLVDGPWDLLEDFHLAPEEVGPTGRAGWARLSNLVHHYGEPGVAVQLELFGPLALSDLSLVWIPETEIAGSGQGGSPPAAGPDAYPKPPVNSRSAWGADPPQCTYSYCNTTHVGIHHSAGASEYNSTSWSQCAANVKSIQSFHMYTRGWCDTGYNYLICVHGQIWEGRGGGDNVRGAHDGHNCGSMGVCMMGYFHTPHNQTLTTAMMNAIGELGAWKCDQQGINPFGSSHYAGYGATMTNVYGHRDVSATACPGDLVYNRLNEIKTEIDNRIGGGGGTEIILDNPQAFFTGSWATGTTAAGKYGADYRWASTGSSVNKAIAFWQPNIPTAGNYRVYFWWPAGSNRSNSALGGVRINGTTSTFRMNQQINGGQWNLMGTFFFPAGNSSKVGITNKTSPGGFVVIADAIRLVKI